MIFAFANAAIRNSSAVCTARIPLASSSSIDDKKESNLCASDFLAFASVMAESFADLACFTSVVFTTAFLSISDNFFCTAAASFCFASAAALASASAFLSSSIFCASAFLPASASSRCFISLPIANKSEVGCASMNFATASLIGALYLSFCSCSGFTEVLAIAPLRNAMA